MPDKSTDSPEKQKRMTRRRLLKLGAYTIPAIASIVVFSDEIKAKGCGPNCPPNGGCQPT